jgi:hypothetical protein
VLNCLLIDTISLAAPPLGAQSETGRLMSGPQDGSGQEGHSRDALQHNIANYQYISR